MNALGEQNNLGFNGTSMSYRIGHYNKNLFIAGNSQTTGTFPGFKLNNQYRVYINYFNAANVQLNQAGGGVEMSLHASPMTKASPPQVRPHKVLFIWYIVFVFVCLPPASDFLYRNSVPRVGRIRESLHAPPVAELFANCN
jgi:hypothetical protein